MLTVEQEILEQCVTYHKSTFTDKYNMPVSKASVCFMHSNGIGGHLTKRSQVTYSFWFSFTFSAPLHSPPQEKKIFPECSNGHSMVMYIYMLFHVLRLEINTKFLNFLRTKIHASIHFSSKLLKLYSNLSEYTRNIKSSIIPFNFSVSEINTL